MFKNIFCRMTGFLKVRDVYWTMLNVPFYLFSIFVRIKSVLLINRLSNHPNAPICDLDFQNPDFDMCA